MFDSQRLTFRLMSENNFDFFYQLFSNKDVMKYTYDDCFESIREARALFGDMLAQQPDRTKGTEYIAALKDGNTAIGIVDYEVIKLNQTGGIFEIGYFILPEYWGCGYATEMGRALINYLFENYNIHKITASCNANNHSSESIMKKLGLEFEGVFKKVRYKDETWVDELRYGLLREEWEKDNQITGGKQ